MHLTCKGLLGGHAAQGGDFPGRDGRVGSANKFKELLPCFHRQGIHHKLGLWAPGKTLQSLPNANILPLPVQL